MSKLSYGFIKYMKTTHKKTFNSSKAAFHKFFFEKFIRETRRFSIFIGPNVPPLDNSINSINPTNHFILRDLSASSGAGGEINS